LLEVAAGGAEAATTEAASSEAEEQARKVSRKISHVKRQLLQLQQRQEKRPETDSSFFLYFLLSPFASS